MRCDLPLSNAPRVIANGALSTKNPGSTCGPSKNLIRNGLCYWTQLNFRIRLMCGAFPDAHSAGGSARIAPKPPTPNSFFFLHLCNESLLSGHQVMDSSELSGAPEEAVWAGLSSEGE